MALRLPGGAPPSAAAPLVALAATSARSGVSVGVHATCARDANASSDATAQAVPPATADALAHAAAAAAVPFTLSLAAAGETGAGSTPGGAVARARGGAAALALAALAMSTGAARLGGVAPELHRHKALLVALADADVALELDADAASATSSPPSSDDLAAAMQAAGVAVVVAAPDAASAAARLGRMPLHVAQKALRAVPAAALLRAAPRAALAARLARLLGPDAAVADAAATSRPLLQAPPSSEVLRPRAAPPTPPPQPPSPRESPPAAPPPAPPLSVSSGVMRPMVRASPATAAEKPAVLAAPGASRRSPSASPSPARRRGSRGSSAGAAQSQSPPQHENNTAASASADVAPEVPTGPGPWPLHLAAARGAPVDIVSLLCESRPGEAASPDGAGRTPLHFAAGAGAQPPLLRAWLAAAPAAALSRDARGWAPLHCAAAAGGRCGTESLQMLLAAAPAAAGWADSAGRTPAALAAAAGWSAGAEVLQSAATEHAQARAAAATAAALARSPAPSPRGSGGGGAWSPPPPSVASSGESYEDPSRRVQAGLAQQRAVEWRAAAGADSPQPPTPAASVPGTPRGGSDTGRWTPLAGGPSSPFRDAPPPSPAPYPASEAAPDDVACDVACDVADLGDADHDAHSVLRWLQEAHARGLPDADPAPAALVARLLGSLAHAEALQHERSGGGGHVSSGADVAAAAALRAAAPEAARFACLAELLRRATRSDPALPWRAAPQPVQAGVNAPRPPSPSLWQRLRGGSGDNASPCALDVAVPACREAMLREALLCGRYAVHPSATPLAFSAASGGVWLRAVDAATPGAPRVALLLARSADRFRRERGVRAAAARASGPAAASAAVVRLLRSHDGAGAPEARGDAGADAAAADAMFAAPCSVTFGEELAARGLEAFPFLLVFEEASASLAQLLAAQAAEAAAAAAAAAQLRAGGVRMPAPALRLRQRAPRTAWGAVRSLGWRLALGLHALHDAGLAHGALCPSHVLLLPALSDYNNADNDDANGDGIGAPSPLHRWVLCDLGASVALRGAAAAANGGAELLTTASACAACYLPPEAVLLPDIDDVALPAAPALKLVPRGAAAAWEGGSLRASVAADGWALGAILYEAATSAPLLPPGPPGLAALAAWDAPALETACASVRAAAHPGDASEAEAAAALAQLLRRLLAPSPAARASSMRDVLAHRFLNATGGAVPERAADIAAATPPLCPPAADAWAPPGGGGGMLLGVAAAMSAGRASPADAAMRPGSAAGGGSSRAASPAAAALPPLPRRSPSPSPAAW